MGDQTSVFLGVFDGDDCTDAVDANVPYVQMFTQDIALLTEDSTDGASGVAYLTNPQVCDTTDFPAACDGANVQLIEFSADAVTVRDVEEVEDTENSITYGKIANAAKEGDFIIGVANYFMIEGSIDTQTVDFSIPDSDPVTGCIGKLPTGSDGSCSSTTARTFTTGDFKFSIYGGYTLGDEIDVSSLTDYYKWFGVRTGIRFGNVDTVTLTYNDADGTEHDVIEQESGSGEVYDAASINVYVDGALEFSFDFPTSYNWGVDTLDLETGQSGDVAIKVSKVKGESNFYNFDYLFPYEAFNNQASIWFIYDPTVTRGDGSAYSSAASFFSYAIAFISFAFMLA